MKKKYWIENGKNKEAMVPIFSHQRSRPILFNLEDFLLNIRYFQKLISFQSFKPQFLVFTLKFTGFFE